MKEEEIINSTRNIEDFSLTRESSLMTNSLDSDDIDLVTDLMTLII